MISTSMQGTEGACWTAELDDLVVTSVEDFAIQTIRSMFCIRAYLTAIGCTAVVTDVQNYAGKTVADAKN